MLRTRLIQTTLALVLICLGERAHAAAPDAFVTPRGGEVYMVGQKQQVHISRGSFKSDVLVELSTDGGKIFASLGTVAAPSKTTKEFVLDYTVPGPGTANAVLRASSKSAKVPVTIVSNVFTITASDLSAGAQTTGTITSGQLGDGTVTTAKIPDGAVTTAKLADGSVTTPKLAAKSATADKLNSGTASKDTVATADGIGGVTYQAIASATVAPGSITNASISPTAGIAYSKLNLANSILSGDIEDGTIGTLDLADGSVTTPKLADGSVTTPKLALKGVTTDRLNSATATNGFLATADGLGGVQFLAPAPVTVPNGSVTNASVSATAAIAYSKLALSNSITGLDIKPATITDANIAPSAAIAYTKLNLANSIAATDLTDGTIGNAKIAPNAAIVYAKLNLAGSVADTDLKDSSITNVKVAATAAIDYSKLNLAGSIVSGDIVDGTIATADLGDKSVTPVKMSSSAAANGNVATADGLGGVQFLAPAAATIANGSVTNASVNAAAAIDYSKLNLASSIKGSDLAAGTITLSKISSAGANFGDAITYDGTNLVFAAVSGGGGPGFGVPVAKSATTTSTLLDLTNNDDGIGGSFFINKAAAVKNALVGKTIGSGAGVLGTSATGIGVSGLKSGTDTGSAGVFENTNAANASSALVGKTNGTGAGVAGTSAMGIAVSGLKSGTDTGSAGIFENTNALNAGEALIGRSNGTGLALRATALGTGPAATVEATNATSAAAALNVTHAGTGNAISVNASNAASTASAVNVLSNGLGDALTAESTLGIGIYGITDAATTTNFIAGVEGDNNSNGPGVLGLAGTNFGAVLGINFAVGAGVEGFCQVDNGVGIFGVGGSANTQTGAGFFRNNFITNLKSTVDIQNAAPSTTLNVGSTSATAGVGISVAVAANTGGVALKVTNGAVALGATTAATFTRVDNAYLVATTAGNLTLPVAAPVTNGTTVWVVNNSGGAVSVTNVNNGPVTINAGNAKQFLFLTAVSATNWIPVQ